MKRSLAAALARSGSLDDLHIDLDVFDGPFDLLVTLILKEEVDLWEVRVSRIVADYVLQLAESDEFDLEATSHFIVMVAALLEMKSRRLLSDGMLSDDDDELLDGELAGEELVVALQRYAQYKRAAAVAARTPRGARRAHLPASAGPRALPAPPRRRGRAAGLVPRRVAGGASRRAAGAGREPHHRHRRLGRAASCSACAGCCSATVSSRSPAWRRATGSRRRSPSSRCSSCTTAARSRLHQSRAFADIVVRRLDGAAAARRDDALPAVG